MDSDGLRLLAKLRHGVFSTAEARMLGYDHRAVTRAVRQRDWVRIRRGFYVFADAWEIASDVDRHLLVARCVVRASRAPLALSHITGALALGVAAWEPELRTVHVTRMDRRHGVLEHAVAQHQGPLAETDCHRVDDDLLVAPVARTILGAMVGPTVDQAVVVADSAVYKKLLTEDDLARQASSWLHLPHTRTARFAARLVDGRAESPGESLGRMLFWRHGIPCPELQFLVTGPGGRSAYLDWMWEDAGVGGEFDGKSKYLRSYRDGDDPGEVVFREKQREDWLLEEGTVRTMRRMTWSDLFTPTRTAARFRDAIARGRRG